MKNLFNYKLSADYKEVYRTEAGKRVLDDLMQFTGLEKSSFIPNDPCQTSFAEGMRRVGLRVLSMLKKPLTELKLGGNNE